MTTTRPTTTAADRVREEWCTCGYFVSPYCRTHRPEALAAIWERLAQLFGLERQSRLERYYGEPADPGWKEVR